ncbi:serine/threonine-protein kinase RsbW [Rhodovulum bhavnagarense]|uniref:Serine/threonine-protein kinase RsbW n=1 Tax=Rhodovulum bhavnagarense TaxID=992286 RepID=A0A4R2RDP8_9RHOB|nr:ATP-binding protein [Rhodovulum bhavnagarense]TCP61592.1 serine/threonine-protein kinase RsbW [Rhodovulum bhavnagarense]
MSGCITLNGGGTAARWGDRLCLQFMSTPRAVRRALLGMREHYERRLGPGQSLDLVETVLAEALNNIGEHAYTPAAPGRVEMHLSRIGDGLAVELRDRGAAMPGGRVPRGGLPPEGALPPEGGFGWFLIRTLAEDLRYCRHGDENRLHLLVSLRKDKTW